eukprot:11160559-Alexandrium_andersonii.AAC.1
MTCDILTRMVMLGSIAGREPSQGLAVDAADGRALAAARYLVAENIVEELHGGRLRFTKDGQSLI